MKASVVASLPSSRSSFYKKKVSPPSLSKRKDSPLRDSLRRTPPEILNAELKLRSTGLLDREMQNLLELDYQEDVRAYMGEMEVSTFNFCIFDAF